MLLIHSSQLRSTMCHRREKNIEIQHLYHSNYKDIYVAAEVKKLDVSKPGCGMHTWEPRGVSWDLFGLRWEDAAKPEVWIKFLRIQVSSILSIRERGWERCLHAAWSFAQFAHGICRKPLLFLVLFGSRWSTIVIKRLIFLTYNLVFLSDICQGTAISIWA